MRPAVKRRIVWAFTIGLGLILLASGISLFAEATAIPDEAKRCAPSIWQSQWPRYLGCAIATHDGLAGGLIAAGGTLFAALLAIDAIQERTLGESDRQKLEQAEAKISAVIHITPLVHGAAECLFAVNKAINGSPEVDKLVALATSHLNAEISRFVVPESLRGLGMDGRATGMSHDSRCAKCLCNRQRTPVAHTDEDAATGNPAQCSDDTTHPSSGV
jgi:hypothetical protein